jgi:hypothetical protein
LHLRMLISELFMLCCLGLQAFHTGTQLGYDLVP